MNKKIIIGSIIAVVILVLVSFTGVVGYQTTKTSTIARVSPLFSTRSKRAINEESKDIACDYFRKGNRINILLPSRNRKEVSVNRLVNNIKRMDDKLFDMFVDLFNKHLNQKSDFQLYSEEEISQSLYQLKNKQCKILRPPTLYTCWFDTPLYCFSEVVRLIIELIIYTPIIFVACFILTTDPTFN